MSALVFLKSPDFSDRERLQSALRAAFPEASDEIDSGTDKDPSFFFFCQGVLCNIMCIDAPAPMAKTDPPFTNAWFWPNAWDELSAHRAHFVVTIAGGESGRSLALILQRVLHSLLSASPSAIGVHYANSGTLLPTKLISQMLQEADQLALMLYISCFFARERGESFSTPSILASTQGMSDFGQLEIEARGFVGSPSELQPILLTTAFSLIDGGLKLKNGDTLSVGVGNPIRVEVRKSMFYEANVYCLYFQ